MSGQKKVICYDESVDYFNGSLTDFIKQVLNDVPEEHKSDARIEFSTYDDSSTVNCEVFYFRDKTQEELDEEKKEQERAAAVLRDRELRQLKQLQEKYGNIKNG